jgi:hypothetical protein
VSTLMQMPPPELEVTTQRGTFAQPWSGWFRNLYNVLKPGITVTVTTAKLTVGGANGSMTFVNGVLTKSTPAT